MRHLITLALGGMLGACLLAGDAEACCHVKKKTCRPAPVACARPVKHHGCGHRAKKHCGLFHNKRKCSTCSPHVASCGYAVPMMRRPMMRRPMVPYRVMAAPQAPTPQAVPHAPTK